MIALYMRSLLDNDSGEFLHRKKFNSISFIFICLHLAAMCCFQLSLESKCIPRYLEHGTILICLWFIVIVAGGNFVFVVKMTC